MKLKLRLSKILRRKKSATKSSTKKRDEEQLAKAIKAQVKQLIEMNRLTDHDGDIKYNFTDGTLVKALYVDSLAQTQLSKGLLSIARFEDTYALIPSAVANKIAERDQEAIIQNNTVSDEALNEDDPYADFVVPDDLMW